MPFYDYKCLECGQKASVFKKVAELDRVELCHGAMQRQVSAPMIRGDYAGYSCPITGKWIEGKRAHQENLKKHGCRVYEPGETAQNTRRRAAEDVAFDKAIDATTEQFIHELPVQKREQLAVELQGGATTEVTRSSPTTT